MLAVLAGCGSSPKPSAARRDPAIGTAYAGPATLNLRKDLGVKTALVGTAKHGDKLEVLETRRRFVRVRTGEGVEGWTDANLLLSEQQMADLRRLADSVAKLPSQGAATVFEPLNAHAEPYRQSPSFFQIPEGGSVDVIAHRVSNHNPPPQPRAPVVRKTAVAKKPSKKTSGPLPPPPVAPGPPPNWQDLSRPRAADLPDYTPPHPAPGPPPDDWALVRTKHGDVGWALARMLVMSIPDEVAQYAEGHRITAYLPLEDVFDKDRNETKHNWLWTTVSTGQHPYEFDSFRVFVWSIKRHRYETAYIERNVKGYYPVETQDGKSFSVVLEDKDGQIYKRVYAFNGYRVQMVSKSPYHASLTLPEVHAAGTFEDIAEAAPVKQSWSDKVKDLRKRWFGR